MQTIKRKIPDQNTALSGFSKNYVKYKAQKEFKGIKRGDNIFNTDQDSLYDAKNVYMDEDGHFSSRLPLQQDELPDKVQAYLDTYGYDIVDVVYKGDYEVYLFLDKYSEIYDLETGESRNSYFAAILDYKRDTLYDTDIGDIASNIKPTIAIIDSFVIVFSQSGAKAFELYTGTSWRNIQYYAEQLVTKTVTGVSIIENQSNLFSNIDKEVYVIADNVIPALPDSSNAADIEYTNNYMKETYTMSNVDKDTELRLVRPLNTVLLDNAMWSFGVSNNELIIAVATNKFVNISFNSGSSFTQIYYPEYSSAFCNCASISKDGQAFFFVTSDKLYRCNVSYSDDRLSEYEWEYFEYPSSVPFAENSAWNGDDYVTGDWNTKEEFAFHCIVADKCKNASLQNRVNTALLVFYKRASDTSLQYKIHWNLDNMDSYNKSMVYLALNDRPNAGFGAYNTITEVRNTKSILFENSNVITYYVYTSSSDGRTIFRSTVSYFIDIDKYFNYFDSVKTNTLANYNIMISLDKVVDVYPNIQDELSPSSKLVYFWVRQYNNPTTSWQYCYRYNGIDRPITVARTISNSKFYPKAVSSGYLVDTDIYDTYYSRRYNVDYSIIKINDTLLTDLVSEDEVITNRVIGDYYIVQYGNRLITNKIKSNDLVEITFSITKSNTFKYTEIPQVTYSDTELYMGIGNKLYITNNTKDLQGHTKLVLTEKYRQTFDNEILGLINISTTEVAIMFRDHIKICSKIVNEDGSVAYAYYNTKLDIGIRPGDDLINTLEGTYTLFPTQRGLASLSYQAFMATNDQIVSYVTDDIKDIWLDFYAASTTIKLCQWRNNLIITNGTGDILLLDLQKGYWFRWNIPIKIDKCLTNQVDLKVLNNRLYAFKESDIYYDFPNTTEEFNGTIRSGEKVIDWFVQSQPLHFNMPNNYKNLKQLVFQFYDDLENTENHKILTQIRLYRKKLTDREATQVDFTIDGFRTFVKRFNYWKINEVQWALANDAEAEVPTRLKLNLVSVKFEMGDEVR